MNNYVSDIIQKRLKRKREDVEREIKEKLKKFACSTCCMSNGVLDDPQCEEFCFESWETCQNASHNVDRLTDEIMSLIYNNRL